MRDLLGTFVGYCTNVHAGATWCQTKQNLQEYALAVKSQVCPGEPMGVGLWLSAEAAQDLLDQNRLQEIAEWLTECGLMVFTLNGFPYCDFHQTVVKHRVYEPDWRDPHRLRYTLNLIDILARLVPPDAEGGVSTLPLGWRAHFSQTGDMEAAARQLLGVVDRLAELEQQTGKVMHLDLEPEPGCFLQTSEDVIAFFKSFLLVKDNEEQVLRHLRICHDICHAAVMFEDQAEALQRYDSAGVQIGKVQVSSAIRVQFDRLNDHQQKDALKQLHSFAEDRYLHQTVVNQPGSSPIFYEDLPLALQAHDKEPAGEWRIHFHVPIYLERCGWIETTQPQILECLRLVRRASNVRHFEVETYAYDVLPDELKVDDLASNIARELLWLRKM